MDVQLQIYIYITFPVAALLFQFPPLSLNFNNQKNSFYLAALKNNKLKNYRKHD